MEIREVYNTDIRIIDDIVKIHLDTFEGFFLTFMGKGFLRQMYQSYLEHDNSNILIAVEQNCVLGFLAYSADMSGLYKYMIRHHLLQFAWYSMLAFFKQPKVFMRLIRAFLKPKEATKEEQYIELASIGVLPNDKSKGIGSKLIEKLIDSVDFDKYKFISLETDAINNEAANHFYKKNGFVLFCEFETREGRKMNEYRYFGGRQCN